MENKYYGLSKKQDETDAGIAAQVEEIAIQGFTVIENVLISENLLLAQSGLDKIYQQQRDQFGAANLEAIKEQNLARSPLVYDDFFLSAVLHPSIIGIVKHFLGDYFIINQQNGIINKPNEPHHQASWHRDLPYQDYVISKPIAIAALLCLDDFTDETGGTEVIPFSHQLPHIPSEAYINKHKITAHAKKGSVIVFNGMLYHRAGYNKSAMVRRGLNTLFTIPLIIQQINISSQLGGRHSEDPFLRKLLGYDIQVPGSVDEWRHNRLKRK